PVAAVRLTALFALKGRQRSAQGNALGTRASAPLPAPKGRKRVAPFQGWGNSVPAVVPRALPWADLCRPFRAGGTRCRRSFPGRCPGLTSAAPSGLGELGAGGRSQGVALG